MNKLDKDYQELLLDILTNGVTKSDRTGTGTLSVFGRQIRHKMSDGFPVITTKKMYWKGIVTELIWFLRGDTSIKYLVDNDCHIWDGDAYKNYLFNSEWLPIASVNGGFIGTKAGTDEIMTQELFINKIKTDDEFAEKFGNLGPIYGSQWRKWKFTDKFTNGEQIAYVNGKIDQIQNLINDLKTNPDSRRLMVSAWNVGELDQMVLPPCHYGFQVYTRELSWEERVRYYETSLGRLHFVPPSPDALNARNIPTRTISLMYNARSQDVPLGTPFNISSYALLLVILGKMVNMIPDELIANMGDCHIYSNQIDGLKEQLTREPYQLPTLKINSGNENWHLLELDEVLNTLDPSLTFKLENYQSHPTIKLPLSN
jgi:thymidylate synthase